MILFDRNYTAEDVDAVANEFARFIRATAAEVQSGAWQVDRCFLDENGEVVGFAIVHQCTQNSSVNQLVGLPAIRRARARSLTLATHLPVYLLIGFSDGVWWVDLGELVSCSTLDRQTGEVVVNYERSRLQKVDFFEMEPDDDAALQGSDVAAG